MARAPSLRGGDRTETVTVPLPQTGDLFLGDGGRHKTELVTPACREYAPAFGVQRNPPDRSGFTPFYRPRAGVKDARNQRKQTHTKAVDDRQRTARSITPKTTVILAVIYILSSQ